MMKLKPLLIGLVGAAVLAGGGYALYATGMQRGMDMGVGRAPATAAADVQPQTVAKGEEATRRHIAAGLKAGDVDPVTGKKILHYHDPMVPGNKFDRPAKSPFMDMMLVPVYADSDVDGSKVTISPRIQQNLGVRTAAVTEGVLSPQLSAVGSIVFNERDQVIVQARATGYVEKLHVRATLDRVSRGQPLAEIYVPDWVAAQEEFLSVKRMQGTDLAVLVDGARQRMRQVGMSTAQIALVESSGQTQPRTTLVAPIGGVVTELAVREGMTVMPGVTLFRINGLGTVWATAEVPESQSALLRPGAKVQARATAVPGATFSGKVQAVLPDVNAATRTLKARLEITNTNGVLVPGMFVQMQFLDMRVDKALLVPTEAVIQTGKRTLVMLAEEQGFFRPVDVQIGIESGGQTEIKSGLQLGQRVVVSSQFLIDSEASLKGVEARLNAALIGSGATSANAVSSAASASPTAATASPVTATPHRGEAKIESVGRDSVTLSHGPIASMKWGSMTMEFKLPAGAGGALPRGVAVGDRVDFEFIMGADDLPQITTFRPLSSRPRPAATASGARP